MYKGFWFQRRCSAAGSRVDCYSDTGRKGLVQVILPWNVKSVWKSWARQRRERMKGVVSECVCVSCKIPGFLQKEKQASRPRGTAPQKILKEARLKLTFFNIPAIRATVFLSLQTKHQGHCTGKSACIFHWNYIPDQTLLCDISHVLGV